MDRHSLGEGAMFLDTRVQCLSKYILLLYLYTAVITKQSLTLGPIDTLSAGTSHQLLMLMNIFPTAVIGTPV